MKPTGRTIVIALSIVLTIGVFIFDLLTPLGMAEWLLYLLPLIIASRELPRTYIYAFAAILTVLIAVGFVYSPPGILPEIALFNRSLAVAVIWMVSILLLQRRRADEALHRAYDELEMRVKERTAELAKANEILKVEITERKGAEGQLQESENKYHGLYDSIKDGIAQTDLSGHILECNQAYLDMLGYTRDEIRGLTYQQLTPAKWHKIEADIVEQQILKRGYSDEYEKEYIKKDGTVFPLSLRVWLIKNEQGEPVGMWGIIRDITERKRIENELKRAKELSDALNRINAAINSTLDFDEIMRKVVIEAAKAIGSDACNITLCRYNQWTVEYTYGLPQQVIGIRFTGEQAAISDLIAATKKLLAIKDVLSDERFRHWILKEYGVRSVLGIPLLVREEVIGILYFIYFSVKPTFGQAEIDFAEKLSASVSLAMQNARLFEERKRTEEELRKRTAELARSNAELEQFAYIASHDLQEPLRMISGFTQLLAKRYKGKLDESADEFIAFIVDGTTRMQKIIEDLLEYSRVGTRGKPFEPTNLEDVFNQAVINLKVTIEENEAQVTHDPLPTVIADPTQMVQLFQNLISNGIKFRKKEETPHVHVSAQRRGNEWIISVRDNGIGIAPEFMSRLFQLFQREHPVEYSGTGIGLAICKRIVERHGGRIWAESIQGAGTTFYFTIPARRQER